MLETSTPLRRRRGRQLAGALVAAAALVLSACGSSDATDSSSGGGEEGNLIGVSFASSGQQRWQFEEKIITDAAAANGDRVIVNFANDSASQQTNQVQSMFQRGIKALVLAGIDPASSGPLITQAHNMGIKVILYDRQLEGVQGDYLVLRNNYDSGKLQAEAAKEAVGCGKYALIRGDQAIVNEHDTSKAWDEVLMNQPCIDIVYDQHTPNWDTATAQREAEAALQSNPDINAFVVMWDGGAQGVVPALKAANKQPDETYVTGTDASAPSLAYIAQGWQDQTVWTPIDKMATDAANIAHAFATGAEPPAATDKIDGVPVDYVPLLSVDKNNLCEFVTTIAPPGWASVDQVFADSGMTCTAPASSGSASNSPTATATGS